MENRKRYIVDFSTLLYYFFQKQLQGEEKKATHDPAPLINYLSY